MTKGEAIKMLQHCGAENYCNHYIETRHCYGCNRRDALDMAIEALQNGPEGEWIEEYNGNGWNDFWDYTCSNCGKKYKRADYLYRANYCPNCRARMKGVVTQNDRMSVRCIR